MNAAKSSATPAAVPASRYKEQKSIAARKKEVEEILKANPDCVPVVCQAVEGDVCDSSPYHLFLISSDSTLESLANLLRERLNTSRGMIMTINGRPFQAGNEMSSLHNVYKDDEDGLLYVTFSTVEQSFPIVEAMIALVVVAGLGLAAYKLVRGGATGNTASVAKV